MTPCHNCSSISPQMDSLSHFIKSRSTNILPPKVCGWLDRSLIKSICHAHTSLQPEFKMPETQFSRLVVVRQDFGLTIQIQLEQKRSTRKYILYQPLFLSFLKCEFLLINQTHLSCPDLIATLNFVYQGSNFPGDWLSRKGFWSNNSHSAATRGEHRTTMHV